MGLLDDAIREHLELKRLRGADPGEVAREQHEALDPVPRDEPAAWDRSEAVEDVAPEALEEKAPVGATPPPDEHPRAPQSRSDVENPDDSANPDDSRETAELDMRTLLYEDKGTPDADAAPGGHAVAGSVQDDSRGSSDEDSLEWEVPGDSAKRLARHSGLHEHAGVEEGSAGTVGEWDLATEQAEDRLQQPRDLMPDPPEQERLGFDQRSPGHSDLDK
jgi:hypothetical protein